MARRTSDPDAPPPLPGERRRRPWWQTAVLVVAVVAVFLGAAGFLSIGLLMEIGVVQDSAMRRGGDLPDRTKELLDERLLEDGEVVKWFYSPAFIDAGADASVITDRRIVRLWKDGGESYENWVWLERVRAVRVRFTSLVGLDGEMWVWQDAYVDPENGWTYGGPDDPVCLILSPEEGRDHTCVESLVRALRREGVELASLEVGGSVSPREVRRLSGAVEFDGDDWEAAPDVVADLDDR